MVGKPMGFAQLPPEKVREIASRGGKAAHQRGTAHKFTPEEARAAGRKGAEASSKVYEARRRAREEEPEEPGDDAA